MRSVIYRQWSLICLIAVLFVLPLSVITYHLTSDTTFAIAKITSVDTATPTKPATSNSTAGAQAAKGDSTPSVISVPKCSRNTSYGQPTPLSLSVDQPGLHQNIQPPTRYTVYGNTATEINNQMAACTPVGIATGDQYAASTDYAINWVFSYAEREDGLCVINRASVGLNLSLVYPSWQATTGSPAYLGSKWQAFISSLTAHENGHVQLDQAAAARILSDLQNFPATDCGQIAGAASAKANANIAALEQANESYDARTGHGATQGAVLN